MTVVNLICTNGDQGLDLPSNNYIILHFLDLDLLSISTMYIADISLLAWNYVSNIIVDHNTTMTKCLLMRELLL